MNRPLAFPRSCMVCAFGCVSFSAVTKYTSSEHFSYVTHSSEVFLFDSTGGGKQYDNKA